MLLKNLATHLHKAVNKMTDVLMLKAMDILKVRLRFTKDIEQH